MIAPAELTGMFHDCCARAISPYQDRTISAVRSEKARSAAGVPASAVIRSQSEDNSRRFRSFISDILSAAFSRTLLFGFRLSRTDIILDISFLTLNSARRVSARMPVGAARTPEAFQRSKRSMRNRKKINGIVAALRHYFSIMAVRPLRCGLRADHRHSDVEKPLVVRDLPYSADKYCVCLPVVRHRHGIHALRFLEYPVNTISAETQKPFQILQRRALL